jgi:hypothetical protein
MAGVGLKDRHEDALPEGQRLCIAPVFIVPEFPFRHIIRWMPAGAPALHQEVRACAPQRSSTNARRSAMIRSISRRRSLLRLSKSSP